MPDTDDFLQQRWDDEILPTLCDFLRIPNTSPVFDPEWPEHGHMERAVELLARWARGRGIEGLEVEVVRLPDRTPVILCEIASQPGNDTHRDTVLLYGHLDKQPEFTGWREGLSPWEPVVEDGRLYGRGSADDGYAMFAALTAIEALQREDRAHHRCVILIEASEESGSPDLPAHVDALRHRLGDVSLVITLDSGGPTWDRLWITSSLRGLAMVDLHVEMLEHGIHSGIASGAVASTFRIVRLLLDRIEDASTGRILVEECNVEIPSDRVRELEASVAAVGGAESYPLVAGARATSDDPVELKLATTWQPTLSYTGVDGMPALADAGNVLRPSTALRLSFRLPPTADSAAAVQTIAARLETDPPDGARVRLSNIEHADGWCAPPIDPWLRVGADEASERWYGEPAGVDGLGGSIPFMAMLGREFPDAQFLIVGVVGPGCTIHGPNEFLDLDYARRLTGCIADVVAAHALR